MKKRKKQDKIVSIAKITLNAIKVLISKALNYSCIIHDKFVSINIVLREFDEIKKKSIVKML